MSTATLSANILKNSDISGLRYSKSTIRKSGIILKKENITDDERDDAMFVLSNYRASHKSSLFNVTSMLFDESILVDKDVIVAKRFKRTSSITKKLIRFPSMDLDRMQDIGGCRAIFTNKKKLEKIKRKLNKNIPNLRIKDYIKTPKNDGYRGIHLICKCKEKKSTQGFFIEIQLRTKIQHSWATAIEIIDLVTSQKLKSNEGEKAWLNFFKTIGDAFEIIEDETQMFDNDLLIKSLNQIKKMNIHEQFSAFTQSLKFIETQDYDIAIGYNLILIDLNKKTINVQSYPKEEFESAITNYLEAERKASLTNYLITALVSTESIMNLKEAYPNYFVDSSYFLENIKKIEKLGKRNENSIFNKLIQKLSNFEDETTRRRKLN